MLRVGNYLRIQETLFRFQFAIMFFFLIFELGFSVVEHEYSNSDYSSNDHSSNDRKEWSVLYKDRHEPLERMVDEG